MDYIQDCLTECLRSLGSGFRANELAYLALTQKPVIGPHVLAHSL